MEINKGMFLKGHKVSEAVKKKIGLANRGVWIKYNCDYCGKEKEDKQSHYKKKTRHFCSMECYALFRKERLSFKEQNSYKGIRKEGESKQIYHKNYCKKHPDNIAHLKARRYARERNSSGSHTLEQWKILKLKFNHCCAICHEEKLLTKDHIIPLSKGGTDFINNIQPLCKNCNSKKWNRIYENPELVEVAT